MQENIMENNTCGSKAAEMGELLNTCTTCYCSCILEDINVLKSIQVKGKIKIYAMGVKIDAWNEVVVENMGMQDMKNAKNIKERQI